MKKISISIGAFMLMIPFRLPISVVMIKAFNYIAQIEGTALSLSILQPNVVLTKMLYNLTLSIVMLYNIESYSKEYLGRGCKDGEPLFWWTLILGFGTIIYVMFDGFQTAKLFNHIMS